MARRIPFCDREPDPARCYERAKPEKETGMGSLEYPAPAEAHCADSLEKTVRNAHTPRQLNSDDEVTIIHEMDIFRHRGAVD